MPNTLVVIPARMASTRLPNKPLADIAGKPMIVHVWARAMAAQLGRVIVATDSTDIMAAVAAAGGEAVMTRADHVSGSDRIFEALCRVDPDAQVDFVINLQGDLPTLDPQLIATCLNPLLKPTPPGPDAAEREAAAPTDQMGDQGAAQIATLAAEITEERERENPNVVKVIGTPIGPDGRALLDNKDGTDTAINSLLKRQAKRLRALYFTRATAPYGDGPLYHHIGIYAYRRTALERFVSLPASGLERREKLEQLRALEDGMRIDVAIVDTVPLGVDTQGDLERARIELAARHSSGTA